MTVSLPATIPIIYCWYCAFLTFQGEAFPGLEARGEILDFKQVFSWVLPQVELSPLDNALSALKTKNEELNDIIAAHDTPGLFIYIVVLL